MTDIPKIVFSRTLQKSEWPDATVANGKIADSVNQLKKQTGKDRGSPGYGACEKSVRRHLGEEYFFIRTSQERKTVSPFHLPKLPAPKISVEAEVNPESGVKEKRVKEHRE